MNRRWYDMQHGHTVQHKCTNCFYHAKTESGKHFCYAHYPQFTTIEDLDEGCEDWEPE